MSEEQSELDIKQQFIVDVSPFAKAYDLTDLRLYAFELPCFTTDGTKYADVVLEVAPEGHIATANSDNPMYVLEFKKDAVDYHSVVSQVKRYVETLQRQLYRKYVEGFVVAPGFSDFEKEFAATNDVKLCSYDNVSNRIIPVVGTVTNKERIVSRRLT